MIIEDEPSICSLLTKILASEGFDVMSAETGLSGVQMAYKELPDLIACDIMLPVLDGYGILNQLRQNPATAVIPFIFLTGLADRSALRLGMKLGADDYLTKPFTRQELLDALATRFNKQEVVKQQYTTALKQATEQLNHLIHYDSLTNLPNRLLLREQFHQTLQQSGLKFTSKSGEGESTINKHPTRGMVSPVDFVPIAEETGLIVSIGKWVLATACQQSKLWHDAGFKVSMAVNISAYQFNQPDFSYQVVEILEAQNLEPSCLELELTESILVQNPQAAIATLKELKGLGIKIAIDDFGTGYSSLSYLKQFPFDTLKIDRSFVGNLINDAKNAAITTALIQLAHSLNLKVIAEGVEAESEFTFLGQHQCDIIQGYLFSPPVSAAAFELLLKGGKELNFDL